MAGLETLLFEKTKGEKLKTRGKKSITQENSRIRQNFERKNLDMGKNVPKGIFQRQSLDIPTNKTI